MSDKKRDFTPDGYEIFTIECLGGCGKVHWTTDENKAMIVYVCQKCMSFSPEMSVGSS